MRKALFIITCLLVFSACLHAFQMKSPENHIDASLAYSQSLTSALQLQGTFNMSDTFYVGVRFTTGTSVYYYSDVSRTILPDTQHLLTYSSVALILGVQFNTFSERFNTYINLMPGFGFGTRQTGTRPSGSLFDTHITSVTDTADLSFFAPSIEFGFNCMLTDNLILSTGWQTTAVAVSDAAWEHFPWFIKLSDTEALVFSIPVRLSWRF